MSPLRRRSLAAVIALASLLLGAPGPSAVVAADPPPGAVAIRSDLVVYGGTPGGILAATSAARAGATVTLLEPTSRIGGMMTNGLSVTDIGDPATVGGISREVFTRIQALEGTSSRDFRVEPHIAEQVFTDLLRVAGVRVRTGERLVRPGGARVIDRRITSVTTGSGRRFAATMFIDASYEGDLLAEAGVSFRIGRESRAATGESLAGARPPRRMFRLPTGSSVPPVASMPPGPSGSGDRGIQDSNFRLCLSSDPANRVAITAPEGYRAGDYGAVTAYVAERAAMSGLTPALDWVLMVKPIPNGKVDVNDGPGVSLALPGRNWSYPTASATQRRAIEVAHERWSRGLLYFLRADPSVPATIRTRLASYGWCADEWADHGYFPRLLYLREGRRMAGEATLRQDDVTTTRTKAEVVAIGSYRLDSHDVTRWLGEDGHLYEEGWFSSTYQAYAIPYRVMTPRRAEIVDLLVPVAASATHVAWSSLRMEPHLMLMGEAAGRAAVLAMAGVKAGGARPTGSPIPVQDVSVQALQTALQAGGSVLQLPIAPAIAAGSG